MDFSKRKIKQLLLAALSMTVVLAFVLLGAPTALATDNINSDTSGSGSFGQPDSGSSIASEDASQREDQTEGAPARAQNVEASLGSISGHVWLDADENGEMGAQETAVANIAVSLFAGGNKAAPVATTYTGANGDYTFTALQPGEYYVGLNAQTAGGKEYLVPMKTIQPGAGNQFDMDGASGPTYSYTEIISLEEGGVVTGVNAGLRAGGQVMPLGGTYYVTDSTAGGSPTGPFSTLAVAVAECIIPGNKYIIEVRADDDDMDASYVTIPPSIDITLTSGSGAARTITQQNAVRHFEVQGSLTLNNIILQGFGISDNGGVSVKAGGSLTMQAQATITGCTAYLGGAVSLDGGTFIMTGGSLTGNQAVAGGGIHAQGDNPVIEIYGGTISGNKVSAAGGGIEMNSTTGIFTMNGGEISGNEVTGGNGGGVLVNSAIFNLIDGEISGNTASTNGGGVLVHTSATFTMTGGSVADNNATAGDGGGVHVSTGASFTFDGGTISGNTALHSGGGVLADNAIFIMTKGTIDSNSSNGGAGMYLMQNSAFTMSGGSITRNKAVAGGGIYAIGGASIELSSTAAISGNTARDAGGGIEVNSDASEFNMLGGTISGNTVASGNGGGVLITVASSANIEGGIISGNTADRLGGGVYVGGSTPFVMKTVNITGNHAAAGGGVYFANGSTTDIYSGAISNNTASAAGGGIEMNSGTGVLNMHGGTISGNEVTGGNGGGVLISAAASVNMDAGAINGNTASGAGGGIYIGGSTPFSVQGGEIAGNESGTNGGGVYVTTTATLTMTGGQITGNTATLEGGGIFTENYSYTNPADTSKYSNLTIARDVSISGNTAPAETMPINASTFANFDGRLLTNSQINYRYSNVLTYDPNGGTGTAKSETYTTPQTVTLKTPGAVSFAAAAGSEFKYWSDNPGGVAAGGLRYEGDGTGTIYLDQSKTLYAVWGPETQGTISGYIFEDKNNNGAYDAGEGLAGRTVRLYKEVGGIYTDTTLAATTNADGMYEFEVDMSANYKVLFDATDGTMKLIAKGAAATSSHANSDGFSDVIEIGSTTATKNKTANAGYRAVSTGGDTGNAGTGNHPQTGDAANLALWIVLMAVSASALVVLLFVRRRMGVRTK